MVRNRVTVQEAAQRLGISESGVRKRVKRRQLDSTHDEGRVYVYLDTARTAADPVPDSVPDKYVARLEDEVAYLREMLRREQEINAMHASNMRALGAPGSERGSEATQDEQNTGQETQGPGPEGSTAPDSEATGEGNIERPQRSLWRRIFGG
jgi:DNA-binding Lrp family transcriptional regulator